MKKQTKVLVAAAMLTLGASFSAMAAQKGTWDKSTGEWMCYDKDGDAYEEEWCLSNGIEYWINDDGVLGGSEWVDDGEHRYYALSDGQKLKGDWKLLYAMEDEEAEEESYFYFDSKGRMVTGAQKIDGTYYYFDEEGRMLTGWVAKVERYEIVNGEKVEENGKFKTWTAYETANVDLYEEQIAVNSTIAKVTPYYANEDGSRADKLWLHDFAWFEDAEELYDDDMSDFYIASGAPKTNTSAKAVDGLTYFFGTDGKMLSGWVGYTEFNDDTHEYKEIEEDEKVTDFTLVYHTEEKGYACTNEWEKVNAPDDDNEDYFWFNKKGELYIPTDEELTVEASVVTFENGDYAIDKALVASDADKFAAKRINGVEYLFNDRGEMVYGLIEKKIATETNAFFYYGTIDQGTVQTGAEEIADEDGYDFWFYFAPASKNGYTKGAAVTGNGDGYCYDKGLLQTSGEDDLYKIVTLSNGERFLVNNEGKIQHKAYKTYECVDGYSYKFTFGGTNKTATEDCITDAVRQ